MAITTAMPGTFKAELFAGAHCFGGPVTVVGSTHSNDTIDGIVSMAGISIGMTIVETNGDCVAGTIVTDIVSATTIRIYPNAIGTHSATSLVFTGDVFKVALIRHSPTGTYGGATVNYSDVTGATDEVTGTGYTAGGLPLTNVAPTLTGTIAFVSFGGTVSWTTATIDSDGCIIYNTNNRLGGMSGTNTTGTNRAVYLGDFAGRQLVSAGTFTIVMPTADATHAILRLQ